MYDIVKACFERQNKGSSVHLEKRERYRKTSDSDDQWYRKIKRQKSPKEIACAGATNEVDELLERKRAKDLILDLNELRDLKLHVISIPCGGLRLVSVMCI